MKGKQLKAIYHDDRGGCGFVYFNDGEEMRVGWAAWDNEEDAGGRPSLFGSNWGQPNAKHFDLAREYLARQGVVLLEAKERQGQ
jgi:hypothetical protein